MTLRIRTLGPVCEFGDGWALFGRVLLVREGWAGPLPVEATRLEVHHYVARRSWPQVVERCAEDGEGGGGGRWLGAPQLARVLGVTDRTVRVWVQAGRFPPSVCVRVGRTTRILWPEAQAYVTKEGADGGHLRAAAKEPGIGAEAGLLVDPVEGPAERRSPVTIPGLRERDVGTRASEDPRGPAPLGIGGRVVLKKRR